MSEYSPEAFWLAVLVAVTGALVVAQWLWRRLAPEAPPRTLRVYISCDRTALDDRDALVRAWSEEISAGRVAVYHDREIVENEVWDRSLNPRVYDADAYIVLLTPDWLNDPLCRGRERPIWERRWSRGTAQVVLVSLRAIPWDDPALISLPVIPAGRRPLRATGQMLSAREWSQIAAEVLQLASQNASLRERSA